jgi:F-type H+-transporting ATPase subunit alpha
VYRRIAQLLGRPPGREAFPPDVFYLHARLLERATRLHDSKGGGSLTALPIATNQAGSIAAYIPTNLISITDDQFYLDSHLFNEGVRPAVDVGLSVSRVGGKAQPKVLRRLAGELPLLYSQLHKLETFARFGAELEPETRHRFERGRRLRDALKQPRSRPLRRAPERSCQGVCLHQFVSDCSRIVCRRAGQSIGRHGLGHAKHRAHARDAH